MPRFASLIGEGMRARGHDVHYWTSPHWFGRMAVKCPLSARKWLGYIDQFLIFPLLLWFRVAAQPPDTTFVVADQALGMWVPIISHRLHVVHCHDFLAQRSAMGEFPEKTTGWTGRKYQDLIRRGYRRARNFISVSNKTRTDLHRFLNSESILSEVVYNPLNYPFTPLDRQAALALLPSQHQAALSRGFILHVGGGQWYKNREGVLNIYREYCRRCLSALPLLMVGAAPDEQIRSLSSAVGRSGDVFFVTDCLNQEVHAAYAAANVLLFPSLEEGFGWPIAEAQASGCLVITTDEAPMNEVGGNAAIYLRRRPMTKNDAEDRLWAEEGAKLLAEVLEMPFEQRRAKIAEGLENVKRFNIDETLDAYEKIYKSIRNGIEDVTDSALAG